MSKEIATRAAMTCVGAVALLVLGANLAQARAATPAQGGSVMRLDAGTPVPQPSGWSSAQVTLGTGAVTNSSPVLADLNGDGSLDIMVGTSDGWVVARNGANGSELWKRNVSSYGFTAGGCGNSTHPINSSPAVGMLRPSGGGTPRLAVVVGVGGILYSSGNGGVVAFDKDGNHLWTRLTTDEYVDGCTDGVWSSPTVADIDGDGRDEVLFGAFDKRFYVLRDDGTTYPNWPRVFLDTIWSSPAVGDLDADGQMEIVVGTDEGRYPAGCPYPLEWPQDYCGGTVYAMRLDGSVLTGFPYFTWQIIQSQPALADLNQDGHLDIVFGTGTYYNAAVPYPGDTFKLYAIDYQGHNLPNWPKDLQGVASGEPAVGNMDSNSDLEVVMGTAKDYCFQSTCGGVKQGARIGYLYAFHGDGSLMWEKQATDSDFNNPAPILAPMIADYDNDSQMEVVYAIAWEVQIRNGLTGNLEVGGYSASRIMQTQHTLLSAPAVGDINGDGKLEIVAAGATSGGSSGAVYAWKPSDNTGSPLNPWSMFRRNAAHTGRFAPPTMVGGPTTLVQLHPQGSPQTYTYAFPVKNQGDEAMTFTASDNSSRINVQPASTSIGVGQTKNMTVTLSNFDTYGLGTFQVGMITMQGTYGGGTHAINSPKTITVTAIVANTVYKAFLPAIAKSFSP